MTFGASKISGVRHLRIGWKTPLPTGTIMVRGGGQLSVLKPAAPFPGRLDVEADWLPALRLKERQISRDEVGREEYALWVLPPDTITRALRFTHTSMPIDRSYAGWLGGVFVLSQRLANIAPQAVASASGSNDKALKLNNESNDGTWSAWDNDPKTNAPIISASSPAWVMLTWPKPVKLHGLNALWAGFSETDVQSYAGPPEKHPRDAADADWQTIQTYANIENQYPRSLGLNWLDFGRDVSTRAVRLRIAKTIDEGRAHGHLKGKTMNGRRVWLGELVALQSLGDSELASAIVAGPKTALAHPPIPIRFTLPEEGFVSLVIDDANGKRIRNLMAETKFPAGENIAWWDGMDDLGRDPEAYRHGVYRIALRAHWRTPWPKRTSRSCDHPLLCPTWASQYTLKRPFSTLHNFGDQSESHAFSEYSRNRQTLGVSPAQPGVYLFNYCGLGLPRERQRETKELPVNTESVVFPLRAFNVGVMSTLF